MSPINKLKELPQWIKLIASGFALVTAIGGFIIAAEDRYVSQAEAGETFKMIQETLEHRITESEQRVKIIQYDGYSDRYWRLKQLLRNDPANLELKQELEEITRKRDNLKSDLGL